MLGLVSGILEVYWHCSGWREWASPRLFGFARVGGNGRRRGLLALLGLGRRGLLALLGLGRRGLLTLRGLVIGVIEAYWHCSGWREWASPRLIGIARVGSTRLIDFARVGDWRHRGLLGLLGLEEMAVIEAYWHCSGWRKWPSSRLIAIAWVGGNGRRRSLLTFLGLWPRGLLAWLGVGRRGLLTFDRRHRGLLALLGLEGMGIVEAYWHCLGWREWASSRLIGIARVGDWRHRGLLALLGLGRRGLLTLRGLVIGVIEAYWHCSGCGLEAYWHCSGWVLEAY